MPLTVMAAKMADQLRDAELTYSEAGSTASVLPPGYHHLRRSAVIGSGSQRFTNAADALSGWQAHLCAGLRVLASSPAAEPGAVVLLGLGAGRFRVGALGGIERDLPMSKNSATITPPCGSIRVQPRAGGLGILAVLGGSTRSSVMTCTRCGCEQGTDRTRHVADQLLDLAALHTSGPATRPKADQSC